MTVGKIDKDAKLCYNNDAVYLERRPIMNPTIETIKTRRSVRKFKPDMLPRETIDQITVFWVFMPLGA